MLVGEIPKGVTNHKYDQTKQILSDTDIYNRKIYREYNEAWQQLYRSLEKELLTEAEAKEYFDNVN